MAYVRDRLLKDRASTVTLAVICWHEQGGKTNNGVAPDVFLNTQIQYYPWSGPNPDYSRFVDWINQKGLELWR